MDEVQRTFIDTNNGWGGNAWGAGLGELQREIQYQNTRDQLANKNAEVEALKAQLFTTNLVGAQTSTLINALKPTTTTGA